MTFLHRKRFLSILSGGVGLLALIPPAIAQQTAQSDQPSAGNNSLEEVVVTARRKEEKAQSVPIAITNVSKQAMDEQRILSPMDLTKDLTGFSSVNIGNRDVAGYQVGGSIGNGYQWIRDVPGVIPYFADAPTVITSGMLFDLSGVQILKGPQGTLFGVATNGGAIQYTPHLPTNDFEGYVEAELGNYGHVNVNGVVNIPVVPDKVLVRVGGRIVRTDGYVYAIANNAWLGSENNQEGRLAATIRPTDDIQNDFVANAYSYSNSGLPAQNRYVNPSTLQNLLPNASCVTQACLITYGELGYYTVPGDSSTTVAPYQSGHEYVFVDTARWDINDDISVKNIVSYTEIGTGTTYTFNNLFGLPNTLNVPLSVYGETTHSWPSGPGLQTSEEFQVLGRAFNDKLSYTVGGFGLNTQGQSSPHVINISCFAFIPAAGGAIGCSGTVTYAATHTRAIYGQGTYDLSDYLEGLSITAGYRYSWDRNYGTVYSYGGTPQGPSAPQVVTGALPGGFGAEEHSSKPSYNISLDWQVTAQTLLYVTNSLGNSHGGLNTTTGLSGSYRAYGPESLNNIEVGIKSDWDLPADMKARTNVSLYYGFYNNIQASKLEPYTTSAGSPGVTVVTANAASGHIEGLDYDVTLLPTSDISLSAGGVVSVIAYDDYQFCVTAASPCPAGQSVDYSHSKFVYTPRMTWHARVAYTLPIDPSIGKAVLAANMSHIGPYYGTVGVDCNAVVNGVALPAGCPADVTQNSVPPQNTVDISLVWTDFLGRSGLDARGYVTNVFGAHYGQGADSIYTLAGFASMPVAPPRMWGAALKYSFGG